MNVTCVAKCFAKVVYCPAIPVMSPCVTGAAISVVTAVIGFVQIAITNAITVVVLVVRVVSALVVAVAKHVAIAAQISARNAVRILIANVLSPATFASKALFIVQDVRITAHTVIDTIV